MSITITNSSYDKVYTAHAWRNNNRTLKLVQGEGIGTSGGAAATSAERIKAPRFQLLDERKPLSLSGNPSPTIHWAVRRPNGGGEDLVECNIISAAEGIIEIPITASVTEFAGDASGEIRVLTVNGSQRSVIKFYGINACIGKGVSDEAIAQSVRFNALFEALQKVVNVYGEDNLAAMDLLKDNGDLNEQGSNPVSSANLKEYLQNYYYNTFLERKVMKVTEIYESELNNATDLDTCYIIKNSGGAATGIVLCGLAPSSLDYGATQVFLGHNGQMKYRYLAGTAHGGDGQWHGWYDIENTSNKDTASLSDSNNKYPSSKLVKDSLAGKEDVSNKEKIGSSSTPSLSNDDNKYPSSKLVGNLLSGKEDKTNKETQELTNNSDKYPSSSLVHGLLANKANFKKIQVSSPQYSHGFDSVDSATNPEILYEYHDTHGWSVGWLIFNGATGYSGSTVSQTLFKNTGEIQYRTGTVGSGGSVSWSNNWVNVESEKNKDTTSFTTTDDVHYPTSKLVKNALDAVTAELASKANVKYAHENYNQSYDDGGVYINDALDNGTIYYLKNSDGMIIGCVLCASITNYVNNYPATQYLFSYGGGIQYRTSTIDESTHTHTWPNNWTNIEDLMNGALAGKANVQTVWLNDAPDQSSSIDNAKDNSTLYRVVYDSNNTFYGYLIVCGDGNTAYAAQMLFTNQGDIQFRKKVSAQNWDNSFSSIISSFESTSNKDTVSTGLTTVDETHYPSSSLVSSLLSSKANVQTVVLHQIDGHPSEYSSVDDATDNSTLYRVIYDSQYNTMFGLLMVCGSGHDSYSTQMLFTNQGDIQIRKMKFENGGYVWENDFTSILSSSGGTANLDSKTNFQTVVLNGYTDQWPNVDEATDNSTLYRVVYDSTYRSVYGWLIFCGYTNYASAQMLFDDRGEITVRTGRRTEDPLNSGNTVWTWDTPFPEQSNQSTAKRVVFDDHPALQTSSRWAGKKYIAHGDSITWYDGHQYYFPTPWDNNPIARGYTSVVSELLGLDYNRSTDNKGISGYSIAESDNNKSSQTGKYYAIVDIIANEVDLENENYINYTNYDICTILGGTNDFRKDVPLGNIGSLGDSVNSFNLKTFFGAYRKCIELILAANPQIRLVLITPMQRDPNSDANSYEALYDSDTVNGAGHKLIDYVNAVKQLGKMYGLPICDLYSNSGITKLTFNAYTIDGLHPNDAGFARIGEVLADTITSGGNNDIITKTSELTNDSGFLTLSDLPIYNGGVS